MRIQTLGLPVRRRPGAGTRHGHRLPFCAMWTSALLVLLTCGAEAARGQAASVRLWPTAVVVDETVRVSDLCQLKGFDPAAEQRLFSLKVTDAPMPGGSRLVRLDDVRSALHAGGINLASLTFRGASECAVLRPAEIELRTRPGQSPAKSRPEAEAQGSDRLSAVPGLSAVPATAQAGEASARDAFQPGTPGSTPPRTLRHFVEDFFHAELSRYRGRAEVLFDRASQGLLDLSGPDYQFRVRRRHGPPLGLVSLEVEVISDGAAVQSVPIAAQVAMTRPVVIARRAINQGATIQPSDVQRRAMSFTKLANLGVSDEARVLGQRAKRFIRGGSVIDPQVLEEVPVVSRGQLVTLTSVSGNVRVVTTATALKSGLVGAVVPVRKTSDSRTEMDAVIVAPGAVRIGPDRGERLAANRTQKDES